MLYFYIILLTLAKSTQGNQKQDQEWKIQIFHWLSRGNIFLFRKKDLRCFLKQPEPGVQWCNLTDH